MKLNWYKLDQVKEIDESVLSKIENLNEDNHTKLLIKECYQRNYQKEEIYR